MVYKDDFMIYGYGFHKITFKCMLLHFSRFMDVLFLALSGFMGILL